MRKKDSRRFNVKMNYTKDYTRGIVLEEVAFDEFVAMRNFWDSGVRVDHRRVYSSVEHPLVFVVKGDRAESYYRFISMLFGHEFAGELFVKDGGDPIYLQRELGEITESSLREAAQMAAHNPIKINYLSVRFRSDRYEREPAKIEFMEDDGRIVGYEVCVPFRYRHLFTVRSDREGYLWNNGFWVPPNFRALSPPFPRAKRKVNG